MYAITETGFRAISNLSDVLPGEVLSDEIPQLLLSRMKAAEVRDTRSRLLRASDWTQIADNSLDATQRVAWIAYRQALRDVPLQAGFPQDVRWPAAPAISSGEANELPQQS